MLLQSVPKIKQARSPSPVQGGQVVGISWGKTSLHTKAACTELKRESVKICERRVSTSVVRVCTSVVTVNNGESNAPTAVGVVPGDMTYDRRSNRAWWPSSSTTTGGQIGRGGHQVVLRQGREGWQFRGGDFAVASQGWQLRGDDSGVEKYLQMTTKGLRLRVTILERW